MRPVLPATGSVSTEIAATLEQVWPFICDPTIPARFSQELREADFVEAYGPRRGAVIRGRNARGDVEWSTLSTVVDCEEPRLFRWATGGDGDPTATWTLEATANDHGVVLTHAVEIHPGKAPLGAAIEAEPERASEIVIARMAEVLANMRATVEGIAALAIDVPTR